MRSTAARQVEPHHPTSPPELAQSLTNAVSSEQPQSAAHPLHRCFDLCLTVCLTVRPSCCLCRCLTPQAFTTTLLHAWFSRKFAVGCAILFPVAVTVYVTW